MQSVQVRDPVSNIRMFDLSIDNSGKMVIVVKVGKIIVTTPLSTILYQAEILQASQQSQS